MYTATDKDMKSKLNKDMDYLVEELQAGNPIAQQVLWQAYLPKITGICRRIVKDPLIADEIAVEVLGDFVIRYVHTIENPAATVAYLRLTAIRRARKMKEKRDRNVELPDDLGKESQIATQTEDGALHAVVEPRLEKCLEKLKPKARRMVQLSFFKELNHKQIGEILGSSGQYVGRMISKSLTFLKRCIKYESLMNQEPAK
jgi:RNA polymerase sigma-70 factor (ECF subfamily)